MVTVNELVTVAGAVYTTEVVVLLESAPQAVPVQPLPLRDQVTPALFVSLATLAVSVTASPASIEVFAGVTMLTVGVLDSEFELEDLPKHPARPARRKTLPRAITALAQRDLQGTMGRSGEFILMQLTEHRSYVASGKAKSGRSFRDFV